ncbi:Uncharacterised protein [Mycobacteroides abscessus subsp. massiliense]|nr:Uncharacterised protein [Mycobacteroides abscessus subsp. massiliense]
MPATLLRVVGASGPAGFPPGTRVVGASVGAMFLPGTVMRVVAGASPLSLPARLTGVVGGAGGGGVGRAGADGSCWRGVGVDGSRVRSEAIGNLVVRALDPTGDEAAAMACSRPVGRLRSSGRVTSPRPSLTWIRFIHAGAHQQSSPSSFMTAGMSSMRTTVASRMRAAIRPNARYFIITRSEKAKPPATTIRIKAAAVMIRPVLAVPTRTASVVESP